MARKSDARTDPWRVLEVAQGARPAVVDAAYRALIKDCHHDTEGHDTHLFKAITEAHETLSDPKKREALEAPVKKEKGTVVGNYRILKEIASGGFGTTYLAEHILAGEPVCVKHCHHLAAAYEATLITEAKAVWDLRHYSLPVMRDFLRLDDGSLALVMSYIPGPTIEQYVKKNGRMDAESVAWIAERVMNVLRYLHHHGVVHGDIKPQNIILQEETHQIVVVDFGLSMVKPNRNSDPKGYTPVFSPPEQLNGSPLVPESDLYSLGMTMLFALSGSAEEAKRLNVPDDAPDALCRFIKTLLVRSVRDRPNWKEGLYEAFQDVREEAFGRRSSSMKPIGGF